MRAACTRLGLARLPLVQLHWDDWGAPGYVDVALHLADLKRRGLVAAVGVCNWDVPRLLELIKAGVTPVSNQVWQGGMRSGSMLQMCSRRQLPAALRGCWGICIWRSTLLPRRARPPGLLQRH